VVAVYNVFVAYFVIQQWVILIGKVGALRIAFNHIVGIVKKVTAEISTLPKVLL
jgi:hypothetical protein